MYRLIVPAVLAVCLSVVAGAAETAKVIMWDDLIPAGPPIEDPFEDLSQDVQDDLSMVLRGRRDMELDLVEIGSDYHKLLQETERGLVEQGIDVDGLLAKFDDLIEEVELRGAQVVPELEGQIVRLPGYALPLEFTEGGIREFLLVPYVGACIHTPPPPPNQMVYVRLDEEFVLESLFDPVWITGRLETEQASRSLSFVDGEADVATGYAMTATLVEPYH